MQKPVLTCHIINVYNLKGKQKEEPLFSHQPDDKGESLICSEWKRVIS